MPLKNAVRGWRALPRLHRRLLSLLTVLVAVAFWWPAGEPALEAATQLPSTHEFFDLDSAGLMLDGSVQGSASSVPSVPVQPSADDHIIVYEITQGDSLSEIFERLGVGQTPMYQIVSADESLLALDVLRPGQRLTFVSDPDTGQLESLELYVHAGYQVLYSRVDDANFEYIETLIEGEWQQRVLAGEINGSFYLSARRAGLSDREIAEITRLLEDTLDFRRQIRAGDTFEVVRSEQMIDDRWTGRSLIEAIIIRGYVRRSAFLFTDGNYYDANGESLQRAFMRYPSERRFRISSSFNPNRLHPVTGRVTPHNGTDFAMSTGTPVLSTGDGVVTRVENHPFAGKYIEIQHGSRFTTRYMHLDRILVRNGQSVNRGDRIGLSGATGRVTGPHLHFELHVNGRPVDPMRADIPMASSVPSEHRGVFEQRVQELLAVVEESAALQLALEQSAR